MVVRWEGEDPPDKGAWIHVLREALVEEDVCYWVRFYREPEGWRFDLEYRQASGADETSLKRADESIALHLYSLLVESGRPLDPGWRPFALSPPAAIVPTSAPIVAPVAPPVAEAPPAPLGEAPPPVRETNTESVRATLPAPVLESEPPSVPQLPLAPRPPVWRGLRPAFVYLPAVLLVAFAWWLSRDRPQSRPASPPAPSPSATVSQEALTAEKRLKELEAVVAQLRQERAQVVPGRRPASPASIGATQEASGRPPTQPVKKSADKILAPTPTPVTAPATPPAPTDVPLLADLPVSTDGAVTTAPVPAAAAEPSPTPSPVERGAVVDVNDPGLTLPVPVTQTQPRYPPLALARRLSGTVWLKALVDETGAVVAVSLDRASPRGSNFEDEATSFVRTRVYRPATKQGVPVRVWLPILVEFRLSGR